MQKSAVPKVKLLMKDLMVCFKINDCFFFFSYLILYALHVMQEQWDHGWKAAERTRLGVFHSQQ